VSRNITYKVGKNFWKKRLELEAKAIQSVDLVKKTISEKNYDPQKGNNQHRSSRFDKELHNYCLLLKILNKYLRLGSKNATTYSYMVTSNIDVSGTVMDFLYLKSQETNGKFPEIIKPVISDIIKAYIGTNNDNQCGLENISGFAIPIFKKQ